VRGGVAGYNARFLRRILEGERGPRRDIVVLNAAAALYIAERATSIAEGVEVARATIDGGGALAKLEALVEISQRLKAPAVDTA
jgi:anthranilate phosphoribosyltransferase